MTRERWIQLAVVLVFVVLGALWIAFELNGGSTVDPNTFGP